MPETLRPVGQSGRVGDSFFKTSDVFADLIEGVAANGDRASFETIFRYYMPRLKAWGIRSGLSGAVAEELAQETMISLWRRADTFERSRAGASRWVYAIFRNKRIDFLRRHPPCETELDTARGLSDHAADPERAAEMDGAGRMLQGAIEALPAEQAMVMRAVYFGSKTHREVAKEFDLPIGTVKSRIRLALGKIRLAIGAYQAC